jgi:hypothetical protein
MQSDADKRAAQALFRRARWLNWRGRRQQALTLCQQAVQRDYPRAYTDVAARGTTCVPSSVAAPWTWRSLTACIASSSPLRDFINVERCCAPRAARAGKPDSGLVHRDRDLKAAARVGTFLPAGRTTPLCLGPRQYPIMLSLEQSH